MKYSKLPTIILFVLLLSACSFQPTIIYVGDSFEPKGKIDVYYDASDVKKQHRVIGRLTHTKEDESKVESLKDKMTEKAKQIGADGIIFTDIEVKQECEDLGDHLLIKAKAIKYD